MALDPLLDALKTEIRRKQPESLYVNLSATAAVPRFPTKSHS